MIVTLHDLNFLYEKSDIKIQRYLQKFRRYISRADQLVCISQFAENDARKYLDYQCPCTVIHNGVATYENVTPVQPQIMQAEATPFLFSISTFMRKKNLHALIPMMAHLPEYKLVIAGKVIHRDYYRKTLETVHESGLEQRVVFMGEIPEGEKLWLYQHCSAFLFPSLAEGFGMPPVEAMSFGKPVFVSNRTSIPEICGNLAFYWENFDAEYMANVFRLGMQTCRNDSEYPQKIKHDATSRYSWERTIMKYIELYRKVLSQGHETRFHE
jgi:glycosyltransferase involved in cell wall biosynthesis